MTALQGIAADMREKRLWLLAAALVLALVAVPLLLSSHGGDNPGPSTPVAGAGSPAAGPAPSVQVTATGAGGRATGPARDPFTQRSGAAPATAGTAASFTPASVQPPSGSPTVAPTAPTAPALPAQSGGATAPVLAPTAPTLPSPKPRPAPTGLTPTESYSVSFAITNASGGFDTTDPLERLRPIPSAADPLLVELGVLRGGRRVLFAVEPAAVLSGPGECIPGAVSCQLLALAPGQVESLSRETSGGPERVAWFAVAGISVADHPSRAAAAAVRSRASAAGRRLLAASSLNALSLFSYDPQQGAVLDLRNLTVGGS
jgi:hypothetical protein